MLPGGKAVLFTLRTGVGSWDQAQIVAQSLETGERRLVVDGGTDARYLPTGHLVYAQGGTLFAVPFDVGRLEVTGGPVSLVEGVAVSTVFTGAAQFSISRTGSLVYVPGTSGAAQRTLVWVDREGLYVRPFPNVDEGLWVVSTDGGTHPLWAPDGRELFYLDDGRLMAMRVATDETFTPGNPEVVFGGRYFADFSGRPYDVSPDGQRFLMINQGDEASTRAEIIVVQNWLDELAQRVPVP